MPPALPMFSLRKIAAREDKHTICIWLSSCGEDCHLNTQHAFSAVSTGHASPLRTGLSWERFTVLWKRVKMQAQPVVCVCVRQVAGIKGMLIANKRQDNQVKTYMTYNKGREWRLLQAPTTDLDGNDIHCILVRYQCLAKRPLLLIFKDRLKCIVSHCKRPIFITGLTNTFFLLVDSG